MGMVREQEDMEKEVCEMLSSMGDIQLLSTQVNASTELSVCARPLSYDIFLGGKHVLSFNCPENAITVYHAMRADFNGDIWHG